MKDKRHFDALIIGGSYAGLSAALSLGRALRRVLLIDSGQPCNRQTPHSHNFLTQDGEEPSAIAAKARAQLARYATVEIVHGLAVHGRKVDGGFEISTQAGDIFTAEKLIFATGVQDHMPAIPGFAACWGISVIHCPYCHGYEVKAAATGILGNGDVAFHYAQLIRNWTAQLTLYTNGKSTLTEEQKQKMEKHAIAIVEKEIAYLQEEAGQLQQIVFSDATTAAAAVIYARPEFTQHCAIPAMLGCALTAEGLLQVDALQQTTVAGVYACGDNCSAMRSVANAVAMGNAAGARLNNAMTAAAF